MAKQASWSALQRGLKAPRRGALLLALTLAGALVCAVRGDDVAAAASGPAVGAADAAATAADAAPAAGVVAPGASVVPPGAIVFRLPPFTRLPNEPAARAAVAEAQAAALQASAASLMAAGEVSAAAAGAFQGVLNLHNTLRARHTSPALVWDTSIASIAQAYANQCRWAHNPNLRTLGLGENLALGYPTPTAAVQAWYDEARLYNYARPGFSSATGHFTALVWRSSRRLGCGSAVCRNLSNRVILVCNYAPAGNIVNPGFFANNVRRPTGH